MLINIANITDGQYYNIKDENSLVSVFKELEKLTKTDIKSTDITIQHPEYQWFLLGIMILILFWLWLSFGRFNYRP